MQNIYAHDIDGHHAHIWLKPFKNLLLQNQKADDLGTWYVALGMWGLPNLLLLFGYCVGVPRSLRTRHI